VLSKIDDSALRSFATYPADGSPGSQALVSSGVLGELAQRGETNPRNAMAALEGLSRLGSSELPGAMKQLGLTQEKLTGWIGAASGTDPMSAKGGWTNPETVQRLAVKLAGQPDGAGLATATALVSTALASKAASGLQTDAGLQHTLEDLLQTGQGNTVPKDQKAAAVAALVDSDIFRHVDVLTPTMRTGTTNLIGGAPNEFVQRFSQSDEHDPRVSGKANERMAAMTSALGFSGPESARNEFNSMWSNLVGAKIHEAVDRNSPGMASNAGMLFRAYTDGARRADVDHETKVKTVETFLAFATSGIGGGFSWKLGNYNAVSPLKEDAKGLAHDVADWFVGDSPQNSKAAGAVQDSLMQKAHKWAKESGTNEDMWWQLVTNFEGGRDLQLGR
jgi:hypothetical protein